MWMGSSGNWSGASNSSLGVRTIFRTVASAWSSGSACSQDFAAAA